jgi:hypothetical protein
MARIRVSRKAIYYVLALIVLAAVIFGTYKWQHGKVADLNKQVATANSQNKSLEAKNSGLTSQLNSLKQQKSSTTKYTAGAPCQLAQLSLAFHQDEGGAAGTGGALFAYQNNSNTACTLNGYPGFLALSKDGHVVPNGPVQHSPMPGGGAVKTVTLASGKDAYFRATWPLNSDGAGSQTGCIQPSLVLSVPPNNIYPLAVAQDFSFTMCNSPAQSVSVTPIGQLTDFQ